MIMADDRIFRVEARLKNNRLVKARLEAGFRTVTAAAKAIGVSTSYLCGLETLHLSPRNPRGDWLPTALKLAEFYALPVEHLWPDALGSVKKTSTVIEVSERQVGALLGQAPPSPVGLLAGKEAKEVLARALEVLTPREWEVLRQRFDEDPSTLSEVGATQGLSRERVRCIEDSALRKLHRYFDHNPEDKDAVLDAMRQGALS